MGAQPQSSAHYGKHQLNNPESGKVGQEPQRAVQNGQRLQSSFQAPSGYQTPLLCKEAEEERG